MNNINVTFDLPSWIRHGLSNGEYERVGGVIRNTDNGQIVAHLKENGFNTDKIFSGLNISNIGSVTSILNLGVSVVGFTLVLGKLNQIEGKLNIVQNSFDKVEAKLEQINLKLDRVEAKIDFGYKANLRTGLKLLSLGISNCNTKFIEQAIIKLEDSFKIFKQYLESQKPDSVTDLDLASEFITLADLANVSLTVCYLEIEYIDEAFNNLLNGFNFLLADKLISLAGYVDGWTEWKVEAIQRQQELESAINSIEEAISQASSSKGIGVGMAALNGVGAVAGLTVMGLATGGLGILAGAAIAGANGFLAGHSIGGVNNNKDNVDELEELLENHEEALQSLNRELATIENLESVNFDDLVDLCDFYSSMMGSIEALSELNLSWSEWKELEPVKNKKQAEFIYIIPTT